MLRQQQFSLRRSVIEQKAFFLLLVCAARMLRQQQISICGPAHERDAAGLINSPAAYLGKY